MKTLIIIIPYILLLIIGVDRFVLDRQNPISSDTYTVCCTCPALRPTIDDFQKHIKELQNEIERLRG